MQLSHRIRTAVATTSLASAAVLAAPALASASSPSPTTMTATATTITPATATRTSAAQQRLEKQLTMRVDQLRQLSADVTKSTTLTPSDSSVLAARLASATTSINGLLSQVPTDTRAELRAARRTMIKDNRVFAVLTPQVFEVIEADAVSAQVASLRANEPGLQAEISSLSGQPGYRAAAAHYRAFVATVDRAASAASRVSTTVLAQVPSDYPHDRRLFARANRQVLKANLLLARATYDESAIALEAGSYTGS